MKMGTVGILKSGHVISFFFPPGELDYMLIRNRSYSDYLKLVMLMVSTGVTARVNVEINAKVVVRAKVGRSGTSDINM